MKISATKDFGNNSTNNKAVLPLVLEPTTIAEKEDLVQVNLCGDLRDANSTQVCFTFKVLTGTADSPQEIIEWHWKWNVNALVSTKPLGSSNIR